MMKYKTEYQIVICHNDILTKLHNIRLELWRKSPFIAPKPALRIFVFSLVLGFSNSNNRIFQ